MKTGNYVLEFREIRKALDNNKLVIFVGAGVSANSNLPTWAELINIMAKELDYPVNVSKSEDIEYKYSNDEYIKIPQFLFDKDENKYLQILDSQLNIYTEPNSLNKLILQLLPNHIITTNYDKLIENADDVNVSQYQVISSDKDLLINQKEHYIIKMHGDIETIKDVVLKEDDYLNYSNTHVLIETFIKSLLVDHTFLFVGYSLNDYNLKQIMSWVDFLSSKEFVQKQRHKNYIIQDRSPNVYEEKYWENKRLSIIDSSTISSDLVDKYKQDDLTKDNANRLYTCLKIINDEGVDIHLVKFSEFLLDRYSIFDPMDWIYIDDLLKVSRVKKVSYKEGTLFFYDSEQFNNWKEASENLQVCRYWSKAGITSLENSINKEEKTITIEQFDSDSDAFLEYLLNYQYKLLNKKLEKTIKKRNSWFYYKSLVSMNNRTVIDFYTGNSPSYPVSDSKWDLAVFKFNRFLRGQLGRVTENSKEELYRFVEMFSKKEKIAYNHLCSLINDGYNIKKFKIAYDDFTKLEKTYNNPPSFTTESYGNLPNIRSNVYQYFYFLRYNGLLLDNFTETISYFEQYIKSLLISQKDIKRSLQKSFMGFEASIKNYKFERLDINIFVSFARYKEIKRFIEEESISQINFSEKICLIDLFENFCSSIIYTLRQSNFFFYKQFKNFSILLRYAKLENYCGDRIFMSIERLIKDKTFCKQIAGESEMYQEILLLINNLILKEYHVNPEMLTILLKVMPKEIREGSQFFSIISLLSKSEDFCHNRKIQLAITKNSNGIRDLREKVNFLGVMYPLMSSGLKKKYSKELQDNIAMLDSMLLIDLVISNSININDELIEDCSTSIRGAIDRKNKGFTSFPDIISGNIETYIILHLFNKIDSIDFLREFSEQSEYLDFIFYPEIFDYSKVNVDDYMWMNLINNNEYRTKMFKFGKDIIKQTILNNLRLKTATENQKCIFSRYLASDKEFSEFC